MHPPHFASGEAFYHSESQPQRSLDADDDSNGNATHSDYQLARARTIISKEVRELLVVQRGGFRKALRAYISQHLTRTGSIETALAKWKC